MRSRDFERIYNEFQNYYPDRLEAEKQYYDWIKALRLDESKPYEECRESYLWKKEDIQFIREDADNKYYEVEIGFPTRSMNGNVYKQRDFIAASLALRGKSPSLNHKDEFWFSPKNPSNKWGNIEIVEGKFHENRSKALMKVPKKMICPVCNGGLMTELIDKGKIYNVSLEGDCKGGHCESGECDGFVYLDPPFTLLTSDVLPGIPMTRIKPIEAFLPFSQESNNGEKKKVKLKAIVKETGPQNITQPETTVNTNSQTDPNFRGTWGTPITSDNALYGNTDSSGNTKVIMGTNDMGRVFQSGNPLSDVMKGSNTGNVEQKLSEPFAGYTDFADCVAKNSDEDDPQAYCGKIKAETEVLKEENTSQPKPEDIRSGPSGNSAPPFDDIKMPEGAPSKLPARVLADTKLGTAPAGPGNVVTGTSPVESLPTLEERRARIHAELQAKSSEEKAVLWEQKYNEAYTDLMKVNGLYNGLSAAFNKLNEHMRTTEDTLNNQLHSTEEKLMQQLHNAEVKKDEALRKYNEQCGLVTDLKHTLDETKHSLDDTSIKYNEAMSVNLELSRKLTRANEEYLEIAKDKEKVEEQFNKAKVNAKKTVKLRI